MKNELEKVVGAKIELGYQAKGLDRVGNVVVVEERNFFFIGIEIDIAEGGYINHVKKKDERVSGSIVTSSFIELVESSPLQSPSHSGHRAFPKQNTYSHPPPKSF